MIPNPNDCAHLTVAQVVDMHDAVVEEFGGATGVVDQGLVVSAVSGAQATVLGRSPYRDLVEVAGAYLFFLCRYHPFTDGNKRTALAATIVFLRLNGRETHPDGEEWERLVLDVAESRLDRTQAARRLKRLVGGKPAGETASAGRRRRRPSSAPAG